MKRCGNAVTCRDLPGKGYARKRKAMAKSSLDMRRKRCALIRVALEGLGLDLRRKGSDEKRTEMLWNRTASIREGNVKF